MRCQICGAKIQVTIKGIVFHAVGGEAKRSLSFKLGHWSSINGSGGVNDYDYVGDVVIAYVLMWATRTSFHEPLRSFVLSQLLFGSFVVCKMFDEWDLYCKLVNGK